MLSIIKFSSLFLLLWLINFSKGSEVRFWGDPTKVKDGLTRDVTLTCDLSDTAASSTLIGRRNVKPSVPVITDDVGILKQEKTFSKKSSSLLTTTPYNVDEILSIIVTKNSKEIAAVTRKQSPAVLNSIANNNLQVSGQIINAVSGQGNLTLVWRNPSGSQLEGLECHVAAVDQSGHTVNFAHTFEFNIVEPTIMDVVKHTTELENDRDQANAKIQQLEDDRDLANAKIQQLEDENKELKSNVTRLSHIESGRVCESQEQQHSSAATAHESRYVTKNVIFQKPYDTPPKVVLGYTQ